MLTGSLCPYTRLEGVVLTISGRVDSNHRPPAPKAGALTRLRYAPNCFTEYRSLTEQ